jgi:XTP/dITP diphosphohydrolase
VKVVLATRNAGKLREVRAILGALGLDVAPLPEGVAMPDEGDAYEANAVAKALAAARATGCVALGDDSGLEVDALGGAPGVHSARYAVADAAQGNAGDDANADKLLRALADVPDERRSARFRCAIVLLRGPGDPDPVVAEGRWEGRIARARRGLGGFGYDPVFVDPQTGLTAAELPAAVKNARSHRALALAGLLARLRSG